MKSTLKKVFAAVAFAATTIVPMTAAAQEVRIRFPVEYNADVAPGLANQEFVRLIQERSNGAIKVEFFPSGSLYRGLDLLQATMRGDVEMTTLVSVFWSAVSPQLSIFELPFAFPTHESFYRAADDRAFMTQAFREIEERGAVVIGTLVYDYLPVGNKRHAIRTPKDFQGLKMRALGRTNARSLELLGASPVPINITEVGGALERGVIDGLNTPADAYVSYGWTSIITHLTDTPHFFGFYPWAVNKRWWQSLSEAHRKLIQDTVNEVALAHRERARRQAAESFEKIRAAGVKVHVLTPEEKASWIDATKSQWTDAEQKFGADLINRLRSFQ